MYCPTPVSQHLVERMWRYGAPDCARYSSAILASAWLESLSLVVCCCYANSAVATAPLDSLGVEASLDISK